MQNNPVRVLHFISNLGAGGAERAMSRLLASMGRTKWANTVCSLKGRDVVAESIEASGGQLVALKTLLLQGRSAHSDVVCGWMYHGNLLALLFGCLFRRSAPVIWNIRQCLHDRRMDSRKTRFMIWLGARLSHWTRVKSILYNSEAARLQHEAIGYAAEKSLLMRNGFDGEEFTPDNPSPVDLAYLQGSRLIGIVGRYHKVKGHDYFIRAIEAFKQASAHTENVSFVFVGRGLDQHNKQLTDLLAQHHIHDAVLLGERTDVQAILPLLTVLTSASRSEGLSNTIAEAMLSGVVCVVSDVGDSGFLVDEFGKVVAVGDVDAMAHAWDEILNLADQARDVRRFAGRNRVLVELPLAKQLAVFTECIGRVMALKS